jgi:ribosomal protein S18 acetylase RimI-like enzyme
VKYTLRLSTSEDFEFCYRLNEANFRPLVEELRGWNETSERASMAEQFRPGLDQIVQIEGRDVGHFGIQEFADRIELRMIALIPEVQGRGLGRRLVEAVLDDAKKQGKPVTLWVTDRNTRAVRFYERLGFSITRAVLRPDKKAKKLEMVAHT